MKNETQQLARTNEEKPRTKEDQWQKLKRWEKELLNDLAGACHSPRFVEKAIVLKPFAREDIPLLIDWVETPEFLMQWSGAQFRFPLTEEQLEEYWRMSCEKDRNVYSYSVVHKEQQQVIGHLSFTVDPVNQSARIGKVLIGAPSMRGKGIGSQMIQQALMILFEEMQLHRVNLGVFDFNQSAIACYERIGFRREGLMRECRKIGNAYWNQWEMGILSREWIKNK